MTYDSNSETISWKSVRDSVLADPEVRAEYDALKDEFDRYREPECHSQQEEDEQKSAKQ